MSIEHRRFDAFPDLLSPNDLLVLNDTRVIRARLHGQKDSGGAAELLIERIESERRALCQVRVSKPLKPGRQRAARAGRRTGDGDRALR